uniref:ATP-dependent DNA helicase n=1 Tax=Fagus sylvatica TaxID=28930 RepID=A0A2N9HBP6_FAGSY
MEGKVQLPLFKKPPTVLDELLDNAGGERSKKFKTQIRSYNAMLAMTSMGGKVDTRVNDGRGPYIYRLNGQNHHRIGTLIPADGQNPHFAQLYFYDTENEVQNRMNALRSSQSNSNLDPSIVDTLVKMLDESNILVKLFRIARDRFKEGDIHHLRLRLIGSRSTDGREYNLPTSSEIAAIVVGDIGVENEHRDVIVEYKDGGLKRINELHPSYMALQYPLLFPYGEDGFRLGILYRNVNGRIHNTKDFITMREYYAYRLQEREGEGHTLIYGGRLFQQFDVDAYTCIEGARLMWVRRNQRRLRIELYSGLKDAVMRGDTTPASTGKRIVLPSSFTGSPRYMIENYQDAMAICRWAGYPDLFITFTCNAKWPEIRNFLSMNPGQKTEDRPDVVARVFKIKLDQLLYDLKHGRHFGRVIAVVYTIEYQKRGLPHAHILLFLHPDDKHPTPIEIDRIISAEIPNWNKDPQAYIAVKQYMVHGPCGSINPSASCMIDNRCSKHFPKKFYSETTIDEDGFAIYRRKNNGRFVERNSVKLDNRFIVPHNIDLLVKYQAHINVEWCNRSRSIKYLFKYITKGPDRATLILEENVHVDASTGIQHVTNTDEVKAYLDCRYISAIEACWRIFQFDIHYRLPAVERLNFHLENEQPIMFDDSDYLDNVLDKPDIGKTKFTEWMKANDLYEEAKELTYSDFPSKWVWHKKDKEWRLRKSGRSIGRIYYAHPGSGERFYMRMLLNVIKGPRSFQEIRTVNNVLHPTFRSACYALGLLDDDKEWHEALNHASHWASGKQLRELFVTILIFCEVADPYKLWISNWKILCEDIQHRQRTILRYGNLHLDDFQLQNYALCDIEQILIRNGRSLREFESIPYPDTLLLRQSNNRMLQEELDYDRDSLAEEHTRLLNGLNYDQMIIYDAVLESVTENKGGVFFVYGHGGTGKTYLWKTMISRLRSEGKIVIAVASSGIAALLLPGGRTAHSRFQIPINVTDSSTCGFKQGSQIAELMKKASLIIWDEAPMAHRNCFEAVDRSLRDILRFSDPNSTDKPFGGKTIVLGGDFRQILPVVAKGRREQIVEASINKSSLWKYCRVFILTKNMRLEQNPGDNAAREFAKWILKIGDGELCDTEGESLIEIPSDLIIHVDTHPINDIVNATYPEIQAKYTDAKYLEERAILAPTNDFVQDINDFMIDLINVDEETYLSADSICKAASNIPEQDAMYPIEFLNSLKFPGIPNHRLRLKVGLPIMLLRNLNQSAGLCNGDYNLSSTSATKIYINLEIPEVERLLDKSILHNTTVSKVKEIMVERPLKVSDRELHLHNRKTVAEIKEMEWNSETKEIFVTCIAKIINVNNRFGWYYIACIICKTKVKPTKSFLWCERCKAEPKFAVPSYRIQTEVEDATGSTTFILFDNGVEKIIPKTAKELAEMQDENLNDNNLPKELEKIIGKEYIFQLRLDEYNLKYGRENYTVSRIFDPDISEKNSTSNEAEIKKEIPIRCVGTSKSDNYYNNQKTYADKTMDEYSPVRLPINVENMQSDDDNMTIQRIQKRSKATQEKSSKNKKLRSAKNKEKC